MRKHNSLRIQSIPTNILVYESYNRIQDSIVNVVRSKLEVPIMCKRAAIPNYCNSSEIATPANANEATTINTTITSTTTFTCIDGFTGQGVHPMKVLLAQTDINSD